MPLKRTYKKQQTMKELPYFRFTPSEWQNGKISLEDYELQGFFIQVCCYYWISDCSITLAMLSKRYRYDKALIEQCIDLGIFEHEKETDFITISFLNEQFDTLSEARKRRQLAGSQGGTKKGANYSNAKAKLKQSSTYKDKDKDKDKDNIENITTPPEFLQNSLNDLSETHDTILSDQPWLEIICMNNHLASIEIAKQYVSLFFRKLQNEGAERKSIADFKSHFARWLSIELQKQQKEKHGTKKTSGLTTEAEQFEFLDAIARGIHNATAVRN